MEFRKKSSALGTVSTRAVVVRLGLMEFSAISLKFARESGMAKLCFFASPFWKSNRLGFKDLNVRKHRYFMGRWLDVE